LALQTGFQALRNWIALLTVCLAGVTCPAQEQDRATAAADRQAMLQTLGIQDLRPPVSQKTANYDEKRANLSPGLPDPLVLDNGRPVRTAAQWGQQRRPELLELFSREVLGRVPANAPRVDWKIVQQSQEMVAGIPATTKHLAGQVDNSGYPALEVSIDLLVVTPAAAHRPVPLVMEVAFSAATMSTIGRYFPEMLPGGIGNEGPSWQEQVLRRGWGYAVLQPTSFQEDSPLGLRRGLIGLTSHGQPRHPDDWGALRAWAWGGSRAMDYFETDPAIDARHVAIEGHSRFGKTALVAMATDPRFAVAYISSAGTGGDKLYRHIYGEQLENLAGAGSWHWMAGNFLKYAGPKTVADLPVDAHELIALCAPRPVFIGVGSATAGDAWADPTGEFQAAVAAGPVYRLLGAHDLGTPQMPAMETGLTQGELAFRQHRFGHTPGPNWPVFLDFAARYLQPGK
jgi:hypothetical protein